MADAQTVVNQNGPLPITASFQALSDGPALVLLSGSVWTQNQGGALIGVQLQVDGTPIGTAWILANNTATHMAVVPIAIPYTFGFGNHEIYLAAATGETVSDTNDFFCVTILY